MYNDSVFSILYSGEDTTNASVSGIRIENKPSSGVGISQYWLRCLYRRLQSFYTKRVFLGTEHLSLNNNISLVLTSILHHATSGTHL